MKRKKIKSIDPNFKKNIDGVLEGIKGSLYELYEFAVRDEKTGIYNYRFFKNIFEMEFEKAKRGKQKLSLAVIDIDFFKKFNDNYGHLVGDKVLVELAKTLEKELRKYDILARFGGEEFFVLLPETSSVRGKKIGERLRKSLRENKFLKKYNVTISIGITEYKDTDTMTRMTKRADKALYVSKKSGRDKVSLM